MLSQSERSGGGRYEGGCMYVLVHVCCHSSFSLKEGMPGVPAETKSVAEAVEESETATESNSETKV